jgi:hypothetical protein
MARRWRIRRWTTTSGSGFDSSLTLPLSALQKTIVNQRRILGDRRPGTTACPGCWEMGPHKKNLVCGEEKNILFRADYSSQSRIKISCTSTKSPTNQPRKDPFHLYSISPNLPQFQQSAGATPLWSLCSKLGRLVFASAQMNYPAARKDDIWKENQLYRGRWMRKRGAGVYL